MLIIYTEKSMLLPEHMTIQLNNKLALTNEMNNEFLLLELISLLIIFFGCAKSKNRRFLKIHTTTIDVYTTENLKNLQ